MTHKFDPFKEPSSISFVEVQSIELPRVRAGKRKVMVGIAEDRSGYGISAKTGKQPRQSLYLSPEAALALYELLKERFEPIKTEMRWRVGMTPKENDEDNLGSLAT